MANVNDHLYVSEAWPDGLVLGNPSEEGRQAHIRIFNVSPATREEVPYEQMPELTLYPGEVTLGGIPLHDDNAIPGTDSYLRTGGIFRIYSDIPIVAYQHSPLRANKGNESSLLLPDTALGMTYVVASYPAHLGTNGNESSYYKPSYFIAVALEDDTDLEWTPRRWATGGNGVPIGLVEPGDVGRIRMSRFDTLRIVPSDNGVMNDTEGRRVRDVSGTVVKANKPVWVLGAVVQSQVPFGNLGTGDQLQEVLFPVEHWGTTYVSPAPPTRYLGDDTTDPPRPPSEEEQYLRIYAGQDDVEISSDPPLPQFPLQLEQIGDFADVVLDHGVDVVLSSTRKFMPVQYLRSRKLRAEDAEALEVAEDVRVGDPAMYQLVPVEQFLNRYLFATGVGFYFNYVQIVRERGSDDIRLRSTWDASFNIIVSDYTAVGNYEVATVPISGGGYEISSTSPFGIIQLGFARSRSTEGADPGCVRNVNPDATGAECNSSYAHPGGIKAEVLFVP